MNSNVSMDFFNKLLNYYNFDQKKYTEYTSIQNLNNIVLPNITDKYFSKVINKLKELVKTSDKVLIYGDYDVDGLTSTAILFLTFKKLGKICGYFIPSRYIDGYGLTKEKVEYFHSLEYKYIICVDNGITCFEEVELAKKLGMEIIIIDHHDILDSTPNTEYIFHHHLTKFVDYEVAASSLSLYVSYYLLNNTFDSYFVFLAGIGVLSDVMPLVGNNLLILKHAYQNFIKEKYENISSLLPIENINYDSLSFNLISQLNAPGRIETDMMATIKTCKFLIEKNDANQIKNISKYLLDVNEKKKSLINSCKVLDEYTLSSTHSHSFVIDGITGINGLICSRFLNKYNHPILVCASDYKDKSNYVCSIRSPMEYDLLEFINKNKKNMISFGGHKNSCGFTINKTKYFQIATSFASEMENQFLSINTSNKANYIEINFDDLNLANYKIYESFMPFGNMHEKPLFKISINRLNLRITDKFIKSTNSTGGEVVLFSNLESINSINNSSINFYGTMNKNVFNNKITVQLIAQYID